MALNELTLNNPRRLKTRISLHESNIKITENRKLNVSKHLYEGEFKEMPIYWSNDYTQLQIMKKIIDEFKPNLNKTWIIHTQIDTNIYWYVHIYTHKNCLLKIITSKFQTTLPHTQKLSRHTLSHTWRKNNCKWNPKPLQHTHTRTHTQNHHHHQQQQQQLRIKYQRPIWGKAG